MKDHNFTLCKGMNLVSLHKLLTNAEVLRVLRFVLIGGLATLTDLIVTVLLVSVVGQAVFQNMVASLPNYFAWYANCFEETVSVLAFGIAFFVSYYGHSNVTFHKKRTWQRFLRLAVLNIGCLLCRIGIIAGLKYVFAWQNYLPILVAMVTVTIISYIFAKLWVFAGDSE